MYRNRTKFELIIPTPGLYSFLDVTADKSGLFNPLDLNSKLGEILGVMMELYMMGTELEDMVVRMDHVLDDLDSSEIEVLFDTFTTITECMITPVSFYSEKLLNYIAKLKSEHFFYRVRVGLIDPNTLAVAVEIG